MAPFQNRIVAPSTMIRMNTVFIYRYIYNDSKTIKMFQLKAVFICRTWLACNIMAESHIGSQNESLVSAKAADVNGDILLAAS